MADADYKKLLAKVSLDTSSFQADVKKLKATLDELYQQEKKKVAEQKQALAEHTASVKKNAEQMKASSTEQLALSKKQLESLQQSKQALSEATQATTKLNAQVSLGNVTLGTTLKKRQDIVATYEIEMERIVRMRTPLNEQNRILSQMTLERQRQLDLITKQQLVQNRRIPIIGANNLQTGTTAAAAVASEAQEANMALRLRMNQSQKLSDVEILAERQKIVAQAGKEISALGQINNKTNEQRSQLMSLLTLREQTVAAINRQVTGEERAANVQARQVQIAQQKNDRAAATAAKQVVPAYAQETARLRAQITTGELTSKKEIEAAEQRILEIINAQIKAVTAKVNLDRNDVAELNRLESAAERVRALSAGGTTESGGLEAGFLGKLQRGLVGGLGFRELAGGTFAGVIGAEVIGSMIGSWTRSITELVATSGGLEHLQDTFQRLGSIKGIDTTHFLNQMRDATHNLVGDTQLLKFVNSVWQSDMKVSSSQVIQLTHDVVALGRAQGNSATQVMGALEQAFIGRGRSAGGGVAFQQLGRLTGIQPAQLMLQNVGAVIPQVMQREEALNKVMDVTHQKFIAIGDPAITLTDRLAILSTEWERTRETFAHELLASQGFRSFLAMLDSAIQKLRQLEESTHFGEKVGAMFGGVAKVFGGVAKAIGFISEHPLFAEIATYAAKVGVLTIAVNLLSAALLRMAVSLGSVGIAGLFDVAVLSSLGARLLAMINPVTAVIAAWVAADLAIQHYANTIDKFVERHPKLQLFGLSTTGLIEAKKQLAGGAVTPPKPPPGWDTRFGNEKEAQEPTPLDPAYEIKIAKLRLELRVALDKEALENTKEMLQGEKDANEEAYNSFKESFAQYIAEKKRLRDEDLKASLQASKDEYLAKVSEIAIEEQLATIDLHKQIAELQTTRAGLPAKNSGKDADANAQIDEQRTENAQALKYAEDELKTTQQSYNIHSQIAKENFEGTTARDTTAAARDQAALDKQAQADQEAAARTHAQALLKTQQDSLAEQKDTLENNLKEGLVSADDYLAQRETQINQERGFKIKELDDVAAHTTISEENTAKDQEARAAAEAQRTQDLLKLHLSADDIRTKSSEAAYDRMAKLLAAREKIAATPVGVAAIGDSQVSIIEQEIALTDHHIEQQKQLLTILRAQGKDYGDVLDDIANATEKQQQLNEQLAEARDILTPMAGLLNKVAGIGSSLSSSIGMQRVFAGMQSGAESLNATAAWQKDIAKQTGNQNPFAGFAKQAQDTFATLREQSNTASDTVHNFSSALSEAIRMVLSFGGALSGGSVISTSALPQHAEGTWSVPETGPAIVHKGEVILPQAVAKEILPQAIATANLPHYESGTLPQSIYQQMANAPKTFTNTTQTAAQQLTGILKPLTTAFVQLSGSVTQVAQKMANLATGTTPGATPPATQQNLQGVAVGNAATTGDNALPMTLPGGSPADLASLPTPPASALKKLEDALTGGGGGGAVGALRNFTTRMTSAVGAVGGFLQATLGAQTGTQGLVGGAIGGMGLGGKIGNAVMPGIGGMVGSLIGGIGGGIMGMIEGQKNQNALQTIANMVSQINYNIALMASGLQGLSVTIANVGSIYSQLETAPTPTSSSKTAQQTALTQTASQMQQLADQQQQTLINLQNQVNNLVVPTGYQQYMTSIESIFTQYKSFAEAAQNVQQLTQAQQYLTLAMQQYATTQATQVQSAEVSAIQNGLQLNNLYIQRQQLMEQFAQQEQSIMSGGVAVREETASASKAGQLQQMQVQYNQQMDQMNMQIATAQYQYETQQQIYGLATTRVGLETQLLTLQMSQTDQQNASNAALLNIVNVIRSTPASQLSTTPQLMAALGLPYSGPTSAQVGPQLAPGQIGTPGTPQQFMQALESSGLGQQTISGMGLTGVTAPTAAQEQAVIQQMIADSHTSAPNTAESEQVNNLYGLLESILTGEPATNFSAFAPQPPEYPTAGTSPTVPFDYTGATTTSTPPTILPGGASSQITTSGGAGAASPVYYLSDPTTGTVTPVYNTPTALTSTAISAPTALASTGAAGAAIGAVSSTATPSLLSGGVSTASLPNMQPNLMLYGTDASGNPVYVNEQGTLYSAAGQAVGSVAPSSTFTVTGQGQSGYYTTPSMTVPSNTIPAAGASAGLGSVSGATTTLQDLLQYPELSNQASAPISVPGQSGASTSAYLSSNEVLPAGSGPSDAPSGPVMLEGSSNPFAFGPNVGTSVAQTIPTGSPLLGSRSGGPIVSGTYNDTSAAPTTTATTTTAPGTASPTAPIQTSGTYNAVAAQLIAALNAPTGPSPNLAPMPTYQTGIASVPETGPAILHAGESVLPAVGASATSQAQAALGSAQVGTEQQTSSIASTRIGMEMKLLAMKKQQNQNDLQVLNAYQSVMAAIGSGNFNGLSSAISTLSGNRAGGTPIEDSMYTLYSERGRYGEGGAAGTYP